VISILFKLGEQKDVGLNVSSKDGSNFSFESVTYEYKDRTGTVISEGEAQFDNNFKKTFVLLSPTTGGNVEFKMKMRPLLANGEIDSSKNIETIIESIPIRM